MLTGVLGAVQSVSHSVTRYYMFISEKRQLLIALQRALLIKKTTLIGHLLTFADVIFQDLMNKLETGI